MEHPATSPVRAGTLKRLLTDVSYFRNAAPERFRDAERHSALVELPSGVEVLAEGDASPYGWFLIDGVLSLSHGAQPERRVAAEDPDAGYPIANLRPSRYRVVTAAPVKLIRVEQAVLKRFHEEAPPARFVGGDERGGGSWQSHPFAIDVLRMHDERSLNIPALPGVSARIGQAMEDPDFAVAHLARLIGADPAIAGGLLKIANSALFRGASAVDSLEAAVVRLGTDQTRTLVTSLAAKALFSARRPWVRKRLSNMWRHAVEIGAYCTVLAAQTPGLDRSKSLLLGLLHEIGAVPVLELADSYPELEQTPGILDAVLANLVPSLSAATLASWNLPAQFADAALHQENWYRDHDGPPDETDVLIVAHLHGLIKAKRFRDLPRLDDTPAFARLGVGGLSARASLEVLEEAQQELAEIQALLG